MAIKLITFLCLIVAHNLLFVRDGNVFENCQSADYSTMLAKRPVNQNFTLGPEGFHTKSDSGCYVLDVHQPSFESQHPTLSEAYNAAMKGLYGDAVGAQPADAYGCLDLCSEDVTNPCPAECDCTPFNTFCDQNFCTTLSICQYIASG